MTIWSSSEGLRKLLPGLMILGLASLPSVTWAGDGFSEKSIAGTWAFSADGSVLPPALPTITPIALIGVATFEEDGSCSLKDILNIGGTKTVVTSQTCNFTVEADGTGSIVADFGGNFGPDTLSIVIVDNDEILVLRTDFIVASGSFKRRADSDEDDDD